jgi:hypothetical protein
MPVIRLPARALTGLSFGVNELILIKNWSSASSLRMVIRLDHGTDVEEYEEVIAFHVGKSQVCRWIMWRNKDVVFVQPLIGRTKRYTSVAQAFEAMLPKQRDLLTDIDPVGWPS